MKILPNQMQSIRLITKLHKTTAIIHERTLKINTDLSPHLIAIEIDDC